MFAITLVSRSTSPRFSPYRIHRYRDRFMYVQNEVAHGKDIARQSEQVGFGGKFTQSAPGTIRRDALSSGKGPG